MELRPIKRFCVPKGSGNACPAVYRTDDPDVIAIQGYDLDRSDLPDGESIITVPVELVAWLKSAELDADQP